MSNFDLAICGLGSAGGGLLLAAANYGVLDELLNSGVVGFERQPIDSLVSNIGSFQIAGNSLGAAFLEILTDPAGPRVLSGLDDTDEVRRLEEVAGTYPELSRIGAFQNLVSRRTAALLAETPGCELRTGTSVVAVDVREGGARVVTSDGSAVTARNVALTSGGSECVDLDTGIVRRIVARRLVGAHRGSGELLRDLSAADGAEKVVIFGGSHSAWAAAVGLLSRDPDRAITLVERRWPPLFYPSRADADADGFAYHPVQDVCPLSGRVHRLGGLRGPARELARDVMAGRVPNVVVRNVATGWDAEELIDEKVLPADLLVTGFGYGPHLPVLTRDGIPLKLLHAGAGLAVGSTGTIRDIDGNIVPGLFAFGLGAGLTPSAEVGGESSYRGRLDGVWLYQHQVGKAVLRSMGLL